MPQADSTDTTNPPVTRQQVAAAIDSLIDLLDTLDSDTDLEPGDEEPPLGWTDMESRFGKYDTPAGEDEPSLGFSTGGFMPEMQRQEGCGFHMSADGGQDLEDEHDGAEPGEDSEPDVDSEYSLGWGTGDSQTGGTWSCVTDLEQGVGAVRKKRPASQTGGKVCRGSILV